MRIDFARIVKLKIHFSTLLLLSTSQILLAAGQKNGQKAWRATDVPYDPVFPRLRHLLTGERGCKSEKNARGSNWPPLTLATNLSRAIFKVPRAIFLPRAAI